MGRYYDGDINGKFWFGVQNSTAADRFGVIHSEPNYVDYYFTDQDLEGVEEELSLIERTIGAINLALIEDFFNKTDSYNDEIMEDFHKELLTTWNSHKTDYADLLLGKKIRDAIVKTGECSFTAEL